MIQVNQLSNVVDLAMKKDSNFLHIYGLVHQYYNLSIFLSIPTSMPSIAGYLIEYYTLFYYYLSFHVLISATALFYEIIFWQPITISIQYNMRSASIGIGIISELGNLDFAGQSWFHWEILISLGNLEFAGQSCGPTKLWRFQSFHDHKAQTISKFWRIQSFFS